jgi:uncharacterized protein
MLTEYINKALKKNLGCYMEREFNIKSIWKTYDVALCYLLGSQKELGLSVLQGKEAELTDPESDIDFAVLFKTPPADKLEVYARLSLDLQELVMPFKADLLLLQEVDHLIQLEAIRGACIFASDEIFRQEYEEKVMMFAADEMIIFGQNEKDLFGGMNDGYFQFEYQAS